MSNALTTTSSGFLASSDDAYAALADAASDMGGGAGGGIYMKFNGNDGIFTYGASGDELPLRSQLAFNPLSLERGWICWKDEEVVDEQMVPFLTGRPAAKHELADHGPYEDKQDGWQEQSIVGFKMTEEPFNELIFKATGISKRNAVSRLVQDFVRSYKANPGLVPIVEVDEVEFESKAKGARGAKKHAPTFKIVAWVSEAELQAMQDGEAGQYETAGDYAADEAPAQAALPAPAPEPVKPASRPSPAKATEPAAPAEGATARQTAARRGRF